MLLNERHVIVLITGIPGSGKSTVSQLLARRFARGAHVRGDTFRRMVVSGREEMTADASEEAWRQLRLRYSLGAATADAYFGAGFSVVLQDVVVGRVLQDYVELVRSRPLCVAVLAPTADVVASRELARDKVAYQPAYDPVEAIDHALRTETPRVGLWLDTSLQTAEQTVDEIDSRAWDEGRII